MNPSRDVPCGGHAAVAHHHLRVWSVGYSAFRGFGPGLTWFGDWSFRVQGFLAPGFAQPEGLESLNLSKNSYDVFPQDSHEP